MGGVAGQKRPAVPIFGHFAFADAEIGDPHRIARPQVARPPLVEPGLHVGERRLAGRRGRRRAQVGNHAKPIGRHREQRQHSLLVPVDIDLAGRDRAGQMHVGQNPLAGLGLAGEIDPQLVPHGAVGPVAAGEPGGVDISVSVPSRRSVATTPPGFSTSETSSTPHSTWTPCSARCSASSRSVSLCGISSGWAKGERESSTVMCSSRLPPP